MGYAHSLPAEGWQQVALGTENDQFKARYHRYLTIALIISLTAWANVFVFTPEIEFERYEPREDMTEVVVITPPALTLPPPPREISPPRTVNVVPDDTEIDDEVSIAEIDWGRAPVFQPPGAGRGPQEGFQAFDTKPALVKFVPPVYSEFAREAGFSGVVYVDVLVGTDGRVKQTRLQRGVHPLLDKSAVEAARRARFTPGRQRDLPVEVWVTLPYGFILN